MTADEVIAVLKLEPHPVEGGYFRETYRSSAFLPQSVLPWNAGPRSLSTAIYYLLTPQTVSAMHRLLRRHSPPKPAGNRRKAAHFDGESSA